MRRTDGIGQCEEWMIRRRWLGVKDIQRHPGQMPGTQSIEQRGLVDQPAARDIDQITSPGQQAQSVCVDELARLRQKWTMERENPGAWEKLFKRGYQLHVERPGALGRGKGIIGDDLHPQHARDFCHTAANAAQSNQPQHGARELKAWSQFSPDGKRVSRAQNTIPCHNVLAKTKHEGYRVLRRRFRWPIGRIRDQNTTPGRGGQVDPIDSNACARHHAQTRPQTLQRFFSEELRARDNRIRARRLSEPIRLFPRPADGNSRQTIQHRQGFGQEWSACPYLCPRHTSSLFPDWSARQSYSRARSRFCRAAEIMLPTSVVTLIIWKPWRSLSADVSPLPLKIPRASSCLRAAALIRSRSSKNSGSAPSVLGGRPICACRSFGPTKATSIPGTERMSSRFCKACALSICTIRRISSFATFV